MVYRGKPSAGCEGCRRAKKRCGLEQPACSRCVKLRKGCSGYRDVTQLQIEDESKSVMLKANRTRDRAKSHSLPSSETSAEFEMYTPSTDDGALSELSSDNIDALLFPNAIEDFANKDLIRTKLSSPLLMNIKSRADDVALGYFLAQFTTDGRWSFSQNHKMDPYLNFAIKACGMAALDNVRSVTMGKTYSRSMYGEALGLLNVALRDPVQCRTDDCLMTVMLLSYFEVLTCDSRESIQSWRAHINGATQLLRLRGKAQFRTEAGRVMFRETRAHIITNALWQEEVPPRFLFKWEADLLAATPGVPVVKSIQDNPAVIAADFAYLRARLRLGTISGQALTDGSASIGARLDKWASESRSHPMFKCQNIKVPDSPHVWKKTVSSCNGLLAVTSWQMYRIIRIMNSRVQEMICGRMDLPAKLRQETVLQLRHIRHQMTDEICYSIPVTLGHGAPAKVVPCTVITAFASIWPLFFAGICALEKVSAVQREHGEGSSTNADSKITMATTQADWIFDRMNYIASTIGIRWAAGIAGILRGDYRLAGNPLSGPAYSTVSHGYILLGKQRNMASVTTT